jgi:hypothetical protein
MPAWNSKTRKLDDAAAWVVKPARPLSIGGYETSCLATAVPRGQSVLRCRIGSKHNWLLANGLATRTGRASRPANNPAARGEMPAECLFAA